MEKISEFNQILSQYNIEATCVNFATKNNYSYYDIKLNGATKVRDVSKYLDEISLRLQTTTRPTTVILRDKGLVRLEFCNKNTIPIELSSLPIGRSPLDCTLGLSVSGEVVSLNIAEQPHILVAGTTGSGKSNLLHVIIKNILNHPSNRLFLVDPKGYEFNRWKQHSNVTVKTNYTHLNNILISLNSVMNFRYKQLHNGESPAKLNNIVLIVDEFADFFLQDEEKIMQKSLCELAQKCRAAKIHIIMATQRPSATIIKGDIKANFPCRIACRVASPIDSRIVMNTSGAENLQGKGDALLLDMSKPSTIRFQSAIVT
jgi:S-DNA-T family DNA segregation ATPase FtsK/SpoIIIE